MKITTLRNCHVAGVGAVDAGKTINVNDNVAADLFLADAARPCGTSDKAAAARKMDGAISKAYPPPAPRRRSWLRGF